MRRSLVCFLLAAAAAAVSANAQLPQLPHNWISGGLGAGPQVTPQSSGRMTALVMTGDAGVRLAPHFAIEVTGLITTTPDYGDKGVCRVDNPGPNETVRCDGGSGATQVDGASASLAAMFGESHGTARLIISAGGERIERRKTQPRTRMRSRSSEGRRWRRLSFRTPRWCWAFRQCSCRTIGAGECGWSRSA